MKQAADIIDAVEAELRRLGLWGGPALRPAPQAFDSQTPFFLDTMQLHEWLEYVLIPRLRLLLIRGQTLPGRLLILPLAEELWRDQLAERRRLLLLLGQLERHLA